MLCFLFTSTNVFSEEQAFILSEEQWARPRSGSVVKKFDAVNQSVKLWMKKPDIQRIELRYPGGEDGNLWALELQDWLISLGVSSDTIDVYPGHPAQGELALVVLPR